MAKNKFKEREMYVVKANDLIRKTKYDLTTQQQKIILYAISKIKPEDNVDQWYEFNIVDMCKVCGIDIEDYGGAYYTRLKADLVKLTERKWCKMPDRQMTISWIGDAIIVPLNSTVQIRFNPNMAPYLFELQRNYTQYMLRDVLTFKSKYTIRLYELIQSLVREDQIDRGISQELDFDIDYLKDLLQTPKYKRYADFYRYVLGRAIDEINKKSDKYHLEYYPIKGERGKIIKVRIDVSLANVKQVREASRIRREELK